VRSIFNNTLKVIYDDMLGFDIPKDIDRANGMELGEN
jgi:hypothetical protein